MFDDADLLLTTEAAHEKRNQDFKQLQLSR